MTIDATRTTIPDVVRVFADYLEDNPTWGSLHVVLDDGNVGDDSIKHCIDVSREANDAAGLVLGRTLLTLTKTQRRALPDAAAREVARRESAPSFAL